MDMRRILSRVANKVVIREGRGVWGSRAPRRVIDYVESFGFIVD